MESMVNTKKELHNFLVQRLEEVINEEPNPFVESRMVSYIDNGIKKLDNMQVAEDTNICMYDVNEELCFQIEEA